MYPLRTLESFAVTIGPDGHEFRNQLQQVETFELNGQICVTSAELDRAFENSTLKHYLDQFRNDTVWLLHFDPERDMPGMQQSQKPSTQNQPIKRSCIAWSYGN